MSAILEAARFLTVLPVPGQRETTPQGVARSAGWFPLVGLLIGGLLVGLDRGLGMVWARPFVDALLVATLVVITSGLHLDGLMDTCDGLGGRSREERLAIMSDARTGAFGVAACVVVLMLKWAALSAMPDSVRMESLLLAPVLSRWAMVGTIWVFPYARPAGLGRAFKTHVTWKALVLASALALGAVAGWMLWQGAVMAAIVAAIAAVMAAFLVRRLGGLTGDAYGAVNEVCEVAVLAGLPLVAKLG